MRTLLHQIIFRLRALFFGARVDGDLDEELEAHLAMAAEAHRKRGLSEAEAMRAARVELGGVVQLREEHRERRALPFLEVILQDLRYTFTMLRRDWGVTAFVVLIAGIGIGASATVFSVVNALLLRPLAFADPGRLVWIANIADDGVKEWGIQGFQFTDLRAQTQSFSGMAGYNLLIRAGDMVLTGSGTPARLTSVGVTEEFFSLLGVRPALGRLFNAEECKWNGPRAVLLSDSVWRSKFGADPAVVGRRLILNELPATVVGVMPASYDHAGVFAPGAHVDLYTAFPVSLETHRWGNMLAVVGRLKPGATVAGAQAEFAILCKRLEAEHPDRNGVRPSLRALDEHVNGQIRPALLVLVWAVGVVMLIVCANLASLQMARAAARQKEMAIRAALGADRGRLARQMLTESLVLALLGCVPGVLLALAGTRVFSHLESFKIPLLSRVALDGTVLGFAIGLAVLSGLAFGLLPALQAPGTDAYESLKDGSRGSTVGRRHNWIRGALVVAEVAFVCVLLVGTGLLVRSFLRVMDVQLGFQPERAASLRIRMGREYVGAERRNAHLDELLRTVREMRGIAAAGLTDTLPFTSGGRSWAVAGKGQVFERGHYPEGHVRIISEGYLAAAGIPLIAGREFTERDTEGSERVVLVNQTMARTLWPGLDPIGQELGRQDGGRVVGVVADVRHRALEEVAGCEFYMPMRQRGDFNTFDLVVRTQLPPEELISSVRAALTPVDPNLAFSEFQNLQDLVDRAASPRRFVVLLLGAFSIFALILADLGIYALISYSVSQRTQEFGIRMALGAGARQLQWGVLVQTLGLAGVGMAIGVPASWVLARGISGLLFGVTATDPLTFVGMVGVMGVVAAVAGYLPARRASRVDPMTALRGS